MANSTPWPRDQSLGGYHRPFETINHIIDAELTLGRRHATVNRTVNDRGWLEQEEAAAKHRVGHSAGICALIRGLAFGEPVKTINVKLDGLFSVPKTYRAEVCMNTRPRKTT
jgi:hypothetical protein